METETLERKATLIRYVFEDGFRYTALQRNEFIPITGKQYHRAKQIVQERGHRIDDSENSFNSQYLLQGNVISFSVPNLSQLPHATELLDIQTEGPVESLSHLVSDLDLPIPR